MIQKKELLVVDLDGTVIKSDMLHETFWSALSKDFLIPFKSAIALIKGKANLKRFLGENSDVDIKTLPYNRVVIDFINQHRSKGGRVVLVTATTQKVAEKIASHLNCFDEVYGSSQNINLKGVTKASFQNKKFGAKNYDYIGDSSADKAVWKYSKRAISVDANKSLLRHFVKNNLNFINLKSDYQSKYFYNFIKAIRPHQWLKNLLVFVPMLAAHEIDNNFFSKSLIAFLAFSLVASSTYLVNDLLDLKADRLHPKKNKRPFASGSLPLKAGAFISFALLILGFSFAKELGINFIFILFSYYTLTLVYSLYLKKKAIIDIFVLAGLYTIRAIGGGVATNLEISFWLLVFSIFIFLSLASIKRQSEIIYLINSKKINVSRRGYNVSDLNFISSISIGSGLLSSLIMALYINSPKVLDLYPNPQFLWFACCLFLFWNVRICFITSRGEMHYDPIIYAIKDRFSNLICLSIISLFYLAAIT